MERKNTKSFTFAFSLVQANYWMTACAILGYSVIYLQSLSFKNFTIGIINACGRILGAVMGPMIAAYLDSHPKFPTARMNTPLLFLQVVLFGLLLLFGSKSALTGILLALVIGTFISTNSVVLRFCGDCAVNGYELNYGFARGIGSLGYIIPSVLLGIIFKKIPGTYLPVFGIFLLCLQIVVNFYAGTYFQGQRSVAVSGSSAEESSSLLQFLKEEPVFTRLLLGILFLFFGYYTYATFLINIVKNVGGDTAVMGSIAGVAAALEIPSMFALTSLRKKVKLSTILKVAALAMSVKILATALVTGIPGLFLTQIFQAFGYAFYAASIVNYVSAVIPSRNLAKGQSLIYTMETASGVLASLIAGKLYDITTVKMTLLIGFCVTLFGALLCFTGIRKTE